MAISHLASRAKLAAMIALVGIAVSNCAKETYNPHIQVVTLPPGVPSDPNQLRIDAARRTAQPTYHHNRIGKCVACLVDVEIGALGDTREVDPAHGPTPARPPTGRLVAKIVNHDLSHPEAMYGLQPDTAFEYYVWADTSLSAARITLLEAPAPGKPGVVRAIFQKNLQLCSGHPPPTSSDADFKNCKGVHLSSAVNRHLAGMTGNGLVATILAHLTDFALQPPIWLRCVSGCCG